MRVLWAGKEADLMFSSSDNSNKEEDSENCSLLIFYICYNKYASDNHTFSYSKFQKFWDSFWDEKFKNSPIWPIQLTWFPDTQLCFWLLAVNKE